MTFPVIHLLACTALIAAAFYRIAGTGTTPTAHRFLFPFIVVAALAGMAVSYLYCMEFFVAWYSGGKHEFDAVKFRLTGPYGWVYTSCALAPLLPAAAIIPWLGKRPLPVALLGILAPLPGLIYFLGGLMRH
jgi:hypothetical protein